MVLKNTEAKRVHVPAFAPRYAAVINPGAAFVALGVPARVRDFAGGLTTGGARAIHLRRFSYWRELRPRRAAAAQSVRQPGDAPIQDDRRCRRGEGVRGWERVAQHMNAREQQSPALIRLLRIVATKPTTATKLSRSAQ